MNINSTPLDERLKKIAQNYHGLTVRDPLPKSWIKISAICVAGELILGVAHAAIFYGVAWLVAHILIAYLIWHWRKIAPPR